MKYSFMTFSTPHLALPEVLAVARRYGYDGIELRIDEGHAHGLERSSTGETRVAAREQLEAAGVAAAAIATSIAYADPNQKHEMVRATHEAVDLAADLGARAVRVFGGPLLEGQSRGAATELVAGSLREVADHAAHRGVWVCMETHDGWIDPEHVAAVMALADHPAIAVNWDILHPVRVGVASIAEAFATLKPWVQHVHIHDNRGPNVAAVPIGQGDVNHREALELLRGADYQGFLSGEWIGWEPYEVHLPREIATMRAYEAELA